MNELNQASSVLLVGEGDFSFSAALCRSLPEADICSSSLLTEKHLLERHSRAEKNIKYLTEKGVELFYEVDATRLHDDRRLAPRRFDRIIFNFPHVGGKSNIKKNRELLKDFFCSATSILADLGDICVTLCKGQGGTPVDDCTRKWADTWQVVAMAANSDLALTRVVPFSTSDYNGYTCTGYRGKDRNFLTQGALTHIFRRSTPLKRPQSFAMSLEQTTRVVTLDGCWYRISSYIADKLERDKTRTADHPVLVMQRRAVNTLTSLWSDKHVHYVYDIPMVVLSDTNDGLSYVAEYVSDSTKDAEILGSAVENRQHEKQTSGATGGHSANCAQTEAKCPDCVSVHDRKRRHSPDKLSTTVPITTDAFHERSSVKCHHFLRSSLLQSDKLQLYDRLVSSGAILSTGVVCKRPGVLDVSESMPVQRELALVADSIPVEGIINTVRKLVPSCCDVTQTVTLPNCIDIHVTYLGVPDGIPCNQTPEIGQEIPQPPPTPKYQTRCVAHINNAHPSTLTLDLSALTACSSKVIDSRHLWTSNQSIKNMYPLLWRHDISFWLNPGGFDEANFLDIIRDVAGDVIKKVIRMNIWTDPVSGRVSRCYRQIYQSDKYVMSHDMAHVFQNAIRLTVADRMHVELR